MHDAPRKIRDSATSSLLLLVDGRLPTGGHAHSGGIEAAIADRRVADVTTLRAYLLGRLESAGLVDAAFAVAAHRELAPIGMINDESLARTISPALRRASALQAKGLTRAAHRIWPSKELEALDELARVTPVMWPVALGVIARAARLSSSDGALAAAHSSVAGPAWAAIRLLGLDPFSVVAILADIASDVDAVAERAEAAASLANSPRQLPAAGSPLADITAEQHANWEVRLFVS